VTVLLVALGAAVGAPLRYLTDRAVQARHDTDFPWGTLTVNVIGSFILGIVTVAAARFGPAVTAAIGIGFCGALTTYSTFSYETLRLLEDRDRLHAVANLVTSVGAGLGAAVVGFAVGSMLS
jgi:CrcB protein